MNSSNSHGGDKRHESNGKSSGGGGPSSQHHHPLQSQQSGGGESARGGGAGGYQGRRHETSSPKRFSSSLGSDTGNSTRESECSDGQEQGLAGSSPVSRSPPHGKPQSHANSHGHGHPLLHHPPLTPQQNSDLFDSLAAELRAKLNGNGPPLLLPPRDYDTVHRSKGNLTAIELRRCRNALIVGGAPKPGQPGHPSVVNPGGGPAGGGATGGAAAANANGKQVSSRGSSGIGSDLAPSPERQELNSSSGEYSKVPES